MLKLFAKQLLLIMLLVTVAACANFGEKEEVVPLDPRMAPISSEIEDQYEAALEQLKAEAYDEAEAGFKAITETHDYYAGPWKNLGIIYRHKKQYDEAIKMFERARAIDAANVDTLNQLALMYRKKGDFKQARSLYEEGLSISAEDASLQLNLGILLDLYMGDIRAALPHYEKYQALTGGESKMVKGWVVDLSKRVAKLPPLVEPEPAVIAADTKTLPKGSVEPEAKQEAGSLEATEVDVDNDPKQTPVEINGEG